MEPRAFFAWYRAVSARRSSSAGPTPGWWTATPKLMVTCSSSRLSVASEKLCWIS